MEIKTRNKQLTIANRWFVSSKLCSNCNYHYDEMTLKDRIWDCPNCGINHDRDMNAARNLEKLAVSSTVSACGVATNGGMLNNQQSTSYAVLKQEFNNNNAQDCNILSKIV
ncbi:MAG: transposase [Bacteroidia bacterium]|nr:MAG: transposase [Bacteroidia bacterium]